MIDIGAARGKFVAQLAVSLEWAGALNFLGLELRAELVRHAMEALKASQTRNITFVAGAVGTALLPLLDDAPGSDSCTCIPL